MILIVDPVPNDLFWNQDPRCGRNSSYHIPLMDRACVFSPIDALTTRCDFDLTRDILVYTYMMILYTY